MRVCVFGLRGFPLIEGGVEKHCESLYPRMDVNITIIRRKPYVTKDCRYNSNYGNIRFIDLPSTKIKGFEAFFHSFLATRQIIQIKPDIVHIHNIGPALFSGMIKRRGVPIVLTYHSPNYEHSKWGWFAKKILIYSEKVALKNARKIIFVNRFQMEKYPKEIRDKSLYIPNGIDKAVFSLSTSYLDEIGVKKNKYVLAVGRITPEKGFDTLIKAFKKSEHNEYKLVIAGGVEFENEYYESLKQLAAEDVIFTGFVFGDRLAQLYTNASLYVLSSNNEGFPIVLLEAMSFGLDILASDIPASHLVELGVDDYFPIGDSSILAEKISEKLKNTRKRNYKLDEYNWSEVAKKTERVYKEVINNENTIG